MGETIGFVGLGHMGRPMAENLLHAGMALRVHNRTAGKMAPLVERGAAAANTPGEAAPPGGIVVTMLADDRALEAVTLGPAGLVEALGAGGVHLSMSTVSPATARRLAAAHAERGSTYVAAPVFGRPDAAAARKLWIAAAGPAAALARVRPLLEAMGQGIFPFGEEPAAANVVKLCGNFLIASAMEAMAEAFTLGEKNGIARDHLAQLFASTLFACPIYANYGRMIAAQQYEPAGFALRLGAKDVGLVVGTAVESRTPMPLAQLLQHHYVSGLARGWGELDWSAIARVVSAEAGLPPGA